MTGGVEQLQHTHETPDCGNNVFCWAAHGYHLGEQAIGPQPMMWATIGLVALAIVGYFGIVQFRKGD